MKDYFEMAKFAENFIDLFCNDHPVNIYSDDAGEYVLKIGGTELAMKKFDLGLMMEKMNEVSQNARIFLDVLDNTTN